MPTGDIKPGFPAKDATTGKLTYTSDVVTMVGLFEAGVGHVTGAWLHLFADFGQAELRVAVYHPTGWAVSTVVVDSSKPLVNVPLKSGDSHVSIVRIDRGAPAEAHTPVGYEVIVVGS